MSSSEPAAFGAAADLRQLLQQLGSEQPAPRELAQESAREARMAERMDTTLASLVKARRSSRRAAYGLLAAAALVMLAFGARQLRFGPGGLAISAEPTSTSKKAAAEVAPEIRSEKPASTPAVPAPLPRPSSVAIVPSAPALAPSAEPVSTLAEENQLFKEAAEAGRNGDVNGALSRLDKLLTEHPASPLAQTAQVRKFRLLEKSGNLAEARREAERYLQAYPTGFAVKEAQTLQSGGGGPETP